MAEPEGAGRPRRLDPRAICAVRVSGQPVVSDTYRNGPAQPQATDSACPALAALRLCLAGRQRLNGGHVLTPQGSGPSQARGQPPVISQRWRSGVLACCRPSDTGIRLPGLVDTRQTSPLAGCR